MVKWLKRKLLPKASSLCLPDRTWFYVFTNDPGDEYPWYFDLFTKNTFRHVWCFAQNAHMIQLVKPERDKIDLEIMYDLEGNFLCVERLVKKLHEDGFTVVAHTHSPRKISYLEIILPTCVSFCKIITGFKSYAITPRQFYNHLLSSGGVLIKDSYFE